MHNKLIIIIIIMHNWTACPYKDEYKLQRLSFEFKSAFVNPHKPHLNKFH